MRLSCNGCRVLRKGCSESCIIRPCLQWIKSPEAQAHATMFLAKFYGRAGLLNLINSGPVQLRPAIFRSLMYEACGRIVNPIYGSVGLISTGCWPMVEAALEAVLKGEPIVSIPSSSAAAAPVLHPTCDVRHVSKNGPVAELHKVSKTTRTKFKRTGKTSKATSPPHVQPEPEPEPESSHNSSNNGPIEPICCEVPHDVSADTVDSGSHVSQGESGPVEDCEDVGLDLTLGFRLTRDYGQVESKQTKRCERSSSENNSACSLSLQLQLSG